MLNLQYRDADGIAEEHDSAETFLTTAMSI
jgi:hypothetical protein